VITTRELEGYRQVGLPEALAALEAGYPVRHASLEHRRRWWCRRKLYSVITHKLVARIIPGGAWGWVVVFEDGSTRVVGAAADFWTP